MLLTKAGISSLAITVSADSRSSVDKGVVLAINVSLCWIPFVNAFNAFCGLLFAIADSFLRSFMKALLCSAMNSAHVCSAPITDPRTRWPSTISISQPENSFLASPTFSGFVMRLHFITL